MKVYLAGYIQGAKIEECIAWRKQIRDYYKVRDWPITFLDPLNGKEINTISKDGLTSHVAPNAILHRDFKSVMDCDIVVVNMDTFGEDRPLTGTICELAWAWEHHKPILMITGEPKYLRHPFLLNFSSMIFPTVEKLLEDKGINYFFKGTVNAVY